MSDEAQAWSKLHHRQLSSGHTLVVAQYGNGRFAAWAVDKDRIPECKITVNLADHDLAPLHFHVRLEDLQHSRPIFDALIQDGIAEPTGMLVSTGHVEQYAEIWKLL